MVKMKDIADYCGVSRTAVSYTLNGRYDGKVIISEVLREKIKKAAIELGYMPNRNAAALRKGRNPAIGAFLPPFRSELISDLVFGMSDASMQYQYPVFYSSGYSGEKFSQFLKNAERMSKSGIVIYFGFNDNIYQQGFHDIVKKRIQQGEMEDFPYEKIELENKKYYNTINDFITSGGKVMLINEVPEIYRNDDTLVKYVRCDEIVGGLIAAEHLLECDCQDFFVIHACNRCHRDRVAGFTKSLKSAGKDCETIPIWDSTADTLCSDFFPNILDKIKKGRKPVGLFLSSDRMATPVYDYLKLQGLTIGKDIKVVGYNNLENTSYMAPRLTTLSQPFLKVGAAAMENMVSMLDGKDIKSQVIKPELIVRESTKS